jgi:hypothetical protein
MKTFFERAKELRQKRKEIEKSLETNRWLLTQMMKLADAPNTPDDPYLQRDTAIEIKRIKKVIRELREELQRL